jgi:hypothetical protein
MQLAFCVLTAIVGLMMVINAIFMLVSPKAWSSLPGWIRAQGFWFEAKCARGGGSIEARLTGALLLGVVGLIIRSMMRGRF